MPSLRTPVAIPVSLALLLAPVTAGSASSAEVTDPLLSQFLTKGGAPAAALLERDGNGVRHAVAGPGIRRADHFRAGSITKTFIATVVLQLAAEHRLSLSDPVGHHLPGLLRGRGADGRRITLPALLSHTSGLADFSEATHASLPLTPLQAVRLARAVGEVVTTLDDLDRFRAALLGGEPLPARRLRECSAPVPHRARTAWGCFR